jgi:hypothetical protein
MDLPIACTLTETELRKRRDRLAAALRRIDVTVTELVDGYAFAFAPNSAAFMDVAELVDMERQCCPFLNFRLVIEAGNAPMRLEITGPLQSKALIADFFSCGGGL